MPSSSSHRYFLGLAISCALLFGLIWLYVVTFPGAFLESGYAAWVAKQGFLARCDLGVSMITGDSRAEAAIDPRALDIPTRNISFGASSPIQGYFLVRQAMQCSRSPQQLVFAFAMSDFTNVSPFIWENGARFGFTDFAELNEISSTAQALGDTSVEDVKSRLGFQGRLRNLAYAVHFPPLYFNALLTGQLFRRYRVNQDSIASERAALGHVPYYRHGEVAPAAAPFGMPDAFEALPVQKAFFEKTLALLQQRNIQSVYVPTPVGQVMTRSPFAATQEQFEAYLVALTRRYPNFHVVTPLTVFWPDKAFLDGFHMDASYVPLFTQRFSACQAAARKAAGARVPCDLSWRETPAAAR